MSTKESINAGGIVADAWFWDDDEGNHMYRDSGTPKTQWPAGEWNSEPDKLVWKDPVTNLDSMIVRGPSGSLCGYVGVTKSHPSYGQEYDTAFIEEFVVHGGVTFTGECQHQEESTDICHVSEETVWWIGFDTAHYGDLTPAFMAGRFVGWRSPLDHGSYKNVSYVMAECAALAGQIAAYQSKELTP